jgi:protein O-mannosyl-transferase
MMFPKRFARLKKYGFAAVGLAILIALLYGNSLHNSWHYDDYPNIVGNPNVHLTQLSWKGILHSLQGIPDASMRRPASYFTFALNYYIGHLDVVGYHIVNIAIHYTAALFLFLFLYEVLNLPLVKKDYERQAYAIALLSAFFWAVNPVQVTAVTYIVQRMTSLCALFYVMAMFFYVKARTTGTMCRAIVYGSACLLAAFLSLASKENGAMLPVSLFLLELIVIQGISRESLKRTMPFVLTSLVILLAIGGYFTSVTAILDGYDARPFTLAERLWTQPRIFLFYISLLLYPAPGRLTLLHDIHISTSLFHPWTTGVSLLFLIGMITFALGLAKKKSLIAFSILFFFVNHLIEGSFVPLEMIYEHRNYLPSMFFFVPVAMGVVYLLQRFAARPIWQALFVLTLSLVLMTQGMTVIMRNDILRDELSLWVDNVEKMPHLQRPHHNLGIVHLAEGRLSEGRDELLKALHGRDISWRYNKTYTWFYLGQYHRMIGDDDEALKNFQQALNIASFYPEPYHATAEILLGRNDLVGAEHHIGKALTLRPREGAYHLTYSAILLRKGWPDAAIAEAKRTIECKGDLATAYLLMADAYTLKKDPASAVLCRKRAEAEMKAGPKR